MVASYKVDNFFGMNKANSIINDLKKGQIKPLYLLTGEEPFFIDYVADYIEHELLPEDQKAFNQVVLYGHDITVDDIVSNAKRYPMMADYQVVIVKEAQSLSRTIESFAAYCKNPQPTTVLVLCYKYKSLDKRKALYKAFKQNGVILDEKKIYEDKLAPWITSMLSAKGYTIAPKATMMLVEFLGNDLGKVSNELNKLMQLVKPEQQITPELVEQNIGISKDFNNFELQSAIANRDVKRAYRIVNYFSQNPKDNPLVVTLALLYSFFSKTLKYHGLINKADAAKVLGVHPFFVKDYQLAAKNLSMKKLTAAINSLHRIDVMGKGVGAANLSEGDLLKELLVDIFE